MSPADGSPPTDIGCPTGLAPVETDPTSIRIDPTVFVRSKNGEHLLDLLIRGAKCGGCLSKIEKGVTAVVGVSSARLNLTTGRLSVAWSSADLDASRIVSAVTDLGYAATPYDPDEASRESTKKERQLLLAMGVAGFAMANIMLLSVSVWAGIGEMGAVTRTMMHWISAAIALPAVAFAGRPFFSSAITALKTGNVNMDVPISLAVCLAVGMSLYETFNHGVHAYYDAAVMLLFFLLIGRFLDARLQREAQSAARDLAAMQAVSVTRLRSDGTAESIRASALLPNDEILVAPGERFAVDAEIINGDSDLDTRLVSGETRPATVSAGAQVYSGAINITSPLRARVLNAAEDSMLAEIGKLLDAGEQKRSSYRKIADKAAQIYVPLVHTLAAASFVGWMLINGDIKHAVFISIAVLIITCPCALALAAPVVQVVAVGRLFRKNVYLKSGDTLERIAACDTVVFDKTGTLTRDLPIWQETPSARQALPQAALLARGSRHPFSRALAQIAGAGPVANDLTEHAGKGVEGIIDGQVARLGAAHWILPDAKDDDNGDLLFQLGNTTPVAFSFAEEPVDGAPELIAALTKRGMRVEILSGDSRVRVSKLAQSIGATCWQAGVSPSEKASHLDALESAGHHVLMIGDGLNDAGAIAKAHASLAPGGAVDISRSAADGVYSGEDLRVILDILTTAKASKDRMLENFSFAALYNMVAVPIAVLGFVTPLVAAIAMSGSSLVVTLNAMRLNFTRLSTDD